MLQRQKYYLTTPLYYVNAAPHLGHAYSTLVADSIRRFKRMQGYEAFLLTGNDEHGQNIERIARERGLPPKQHCDELSAQFRSLWERLGIQYDEFIRTTEDRHKAAVLELWSRLTKACVPDGSPAIYRGKYAGWYCPRCEEFKDEAGTREPDHECVVHEQPCQWTEEENLFFRLSGYQESLLRLYQEHPEFLRPETRRNEVISFVRSGLRDLSISRTTLKWGIPVPPWSDEREASAGHVFYVWLDALTGYMSGVGLGQQGQAGEHFAKLWPADLHLVGKEIVRFHAVYWPAFLMAAGLPLPHSIFAHGWLLFEEGKMSKSKGNIVRPDPIREVLGVDALRYFLLREIPFGQDGNFSYDALITRYNSDLANDLGNLSSRVLTMIGRYFGGEVPYPSPPAQRPPQDRRITELAPEVIRRYAAGMDQLEFSSALEAVWELIAAVNKFLVETEPWTLAERNTDNDRSRLATILYTAADALRLVTGLLSPVMPEATAKIWRQLGQTSDLSLLSLDDLSRGSLGVGEKIGKIEPVFPRLGREETLQKLQQIEEQSAQRPPASKPAPAPAAAASSEPLPRLPIDEFLKWELRAGEVLVAERVKGASKLLRLEVDIGTEVRQVLAGIAEHYAPEALVGRKVVILANLEPRKMRGLESNGMLIAASVGKEDRPVIVTFTEDVPNGARLR
ncbi:MAG: methionine--tRNA ligase [Acidobacteria bacterium]|nr:methionine--tRNA ligase [Acidobacteriota bacterium]